MASIVPMSFFTPDVTINPDEYTFEIVDKKAREMMATIESSDTASKNYAVGDYLVLNGLLYKVTSAIAEGGAITPDTNVSATTAASELDSKVNKTAVANNLTTTDEGYVLDARQGKALDDSKVNKTAIANNLTTTDEGYVLDARKGKALKDSLDALPTLATPTDVATANAVGTATTFARADHKHKISLATGDSNGQVKIAGSNVAVKGLQTTAYTTLASLFSVANTTITCNNAANTEKTQTPTAVTGYTPVGIIGWNASGNPKAITEAWRFFYNSSSNKIVIAWSSAIATTASVEVHMLYRKT